MIVLMASSLLALCAFSGLLGVVLFPGGSRTMKTRLTVGFLAIVSIALSVAMVAVSFPPSMVVIR